jgi:hypothetical protein
VIALIGNRPTLQVGPYQVADYDTRWVGVALRQAAQAADSGGFPFLEEIHEAVDEYLESHCHLKLLPLPTLYSRLRRMLEQVGCPAIASHLQPVAPPLTIDLGAFADRSSAGFELFFFEMLRRELRELAAVGARDLNFTGLADCVRKLQQTEQWNPACDELMAEIRAFLQRNDRQLPSDPMTLPSE